MADEYKGPWRVVTDGDPNEVWAKGIWSKESGQRRIDEGYWHQYMYEKDKHKKLILVPDKK